MFPAGAFAFPRTYLPASVCRFGDNMRYHSADISVFSGNQIEITDVTEQAVKVLAESGIKNGLLNLWVPHTTAGIMINERDPELWKDILTILDRIAPADLDYKHNARYARNTREQNARAHVLNCLVKPSVSVPVEDGRALLGTWQSVLFLEMDGPRTRSIHVQIIGE